MKLVFFTPVIKTSAIGRAASLIALKLISWGHELVIVRTENKSFFRDNIHDFGAKPISWTNFSQVQAALQSADALVYHIGDNYEFHQGAIEWLLLTSGLVCLHDFYLGNLFCGWAEAHPGKADAVLTRWYGSELATYFKSHQSSADFVEKTYLRTPLTEWISAMAEGLITHSNWGINRVLDSCPGPVQVVPLALKIPSSLKPKLNAEEKLNILTFGYINKNKRVASIISAIGNSASIRKKCVYHLMGRINAEEEKKLVQLAKKKKINLLIYGEVEDKVLDQAMNEADLIVCLRWPALEAASASAIEALLRGKPTLVTNTAFYKEIPDSCTIKINPENEIAEISAALKLFIKDPKSFIEMGQRAQMWASKTFTEDNYAEKLLDLIYSTSKSKVILNAMNYFTRLMFAWGVNNSEIGIEDTLKPLEIFNEI